MARLVAASHPGVWLVASVIWKACYQVAVQLNTEEVIPPISILRNEPESSPTNSVSSVWTFRSTVIQYQTSTERAESMSNIDENIISGSPVAPEPPFPPKEPSIRLKHVDTTDTLGGATSVSRYPSRSDGTTTPLKCDRTNSRDLGGPGSPECRSPSDPGASPIRAAWPGSSATRPHSKLFRTFHNQPDLFLHDDNFVEESDVDILCVSSAGSSKPA